MSEWDSCGVPSSSAVELVGDGGLSGSSWEFVSECGSVAGSDVPVLAGVGVSAPSVVTVVCEDVPSDSGWDFLWNRSLLSISKKRNFACVEGQEDMNYEGTPKKASPCPKRRMITPLPQQSSFSSMEEESRWSARERTAFARMEQYVNNSDILKLEVAKVEKRDKGRQGHF